MKVPLMQDVESTKMTYEKSLDFLHWNKHFN